MSKAAMEKGIRQNKFLEYARVHSNIYGAQTRNPKPQTLTLKSLSPNPKPQTRDP